MFNSFSQFLLLLVIHAANSVALGQHTAADSLIQRAELLLQRQPDSACQLASNVLREAASPTTQADARCLLGYCATIQGHPAQADSLLQAALAFYLGNEHPKGVAMATNGLGQNEMVQGHFPAAATYFLQALDAAKRAGETELQVSLQNNVAAVFFRTKQYDQSLIYFKQVVKHYEEIGDSLKLAISYSNIGTVMTSMADNEHFQQGVGYLLKSYQIKRKIGDVAGSAISHYNLAQVIANRGDYTKAINTMHLAVTMCREAHNRERLALALTALTELYLKQDIADSLPQARAWVAEALEIAGTGGFKPVETQAFLIQARLLTRLAQYPEAIVAYEQAKAGYSAIGDSVAAGQALLQLAETQDLYSAHLMSKRLYADAVVVGNRAISLFEQLNTDQALPVLYKRMATACRKTGDKNCSRTYREKYQQITANKG